MAKVWDRTVNCMSYALGCIDDWLCARNEHELEEEYGHLLKPVKRHEMKLGKTYIAYRYTTEATRQKTGNYDFHFAKRHPNGCWTHKMGSCAVEPMPTKQVFAKTAWITQWNIYNSKLFLYELVD